MTSMQLMDCLDDEPSQLNGSESQDRQKDSHRSRSKEAERPSRGRESDPRNSRSEDAALPRSRERIRLSDGAVAGDRVWSPQQEDAMHEKVPLRDETVTRDRRSKHRVDEPALKVASCFVYIR